MLTFPFAPRTAAIRSAKISLSRACAIHCLAWLLWPVMIVLIVAYNNSYNWPAEDVPQRNTYLASLAETINTLTGIIERPGFRVGTAIALIVIEIGFGVCALLLLPWAAQPESPRDTLRRTFRIVWLNSGHWLCWIMLVVGTSAWTSILIKKNAWAGMRPLDDYWVYQYNEFIVGWIVVLASAWVLWAWMRAAGTPTHTSCPLPPPSCEHCGYNLAYASVRNHCPECGSPVAESLGCETRRLAGWESPNRRNGLRSFLKFTMAAATRPRKFFFDLPIYSGLSRARQFCLYWLLLSALLSCPVTLLCTYAESQSIPHGQEWLTMTFIGVAAFAVPLALVSLVGAFRGLTYSSRDKRNQLAAAAKVVFYTSPVIILWLLSAVVVVAITSFYEMPLREISIRLFGASNNPLTEYAIILIINVIYNVAWVVLYGRFFPRAWAAVRYANR